MVRNSPLLGVAFAVLCGSSAWAGKQIDVFCSEAVTDTVGLAVENRVTAVDGGTYTCPCQEGDCAVFFLIGWGQNGAGHGHVRFTLYDRYGQVADSLSARAVIGEEYSLQLLITDGPAGEIGRDGQSLQFRVDADRFAQGRVEIDLSGLIAADVRSFTLGGACYEATVSGTGGYRLEIPFTVRFQNLVC